MQPATNRMAKCVHLYTAVNIKNKSFYVLV